MRNDYKFSNDWFKESFKPYWTRALQNLNAKNVLEIGCFEGQATTFIIEHKTIQKVFCIDTWQGSLEHNSGGASDNDGAAIDMTLVEARFDKNVQIAMDNSGRDVDVHKFKGTSEFHLSSLVAQSQMQGFFDLIYVDADHSAKAVLRDAVLAWPLLRKGGVMVFDDYLWGDVFGFNPLYAPKIGIDAFVNTFRDETIVIDSAPLYQLFVQKTAGWASKNPDAS